MTRRACLFALLALFASPTGAQEPPPPVENEVEGVVVSTPRAVATLARPGPSPLDPFEVFRDHCFESNRLHRRSARPANDPAWKPLGWEARRALGIVDRSTVAYGRFDDRYGLPLVLTIDERSPGGGRIQHGCSLMILGDADPAKLRRQMAGVFHGDGTERHVGHASSPSYEARPGWRQWLWSAIPPRNSSDWRVFRSARTPNPNGTFVIVTGASYYSRYAYVAGDLKYNEDPARPVRILALTHTYKP